MSVVLVCLCHPTRDRELRALCRAGVRDVAAVGRACGAGTRCGTCRPTIVQVLAEEDRRAEAEQAAAAK